MLDSIDDSPDDMMFDLSEFLSAHNSTATIIGSTEPSKPPPSSTVQTSDRPSVDNIGVGDLLGSSDSVSTFQTNAKQSAPNFTINSSRPTTSSAPPAPVSVAASQSSLTTITWSEFYSQKSQLEDLGKTVADLKSHQDEATLFFKQIREHFGLVHSAPSGSSAAGGPP